MIAVSPLIPRRITVASVAVLFVAGSPIFSFCAVAGNLDEPFLREGKRTTGSIDLLGESWQTYRIDVPEDAIDIELQIDGSIGDLDLFIRHGQPMATWDEADFSAELSANNENMRLSRWVDDLLPGTYYVDVAFRGNRAPKIDGRRVTEVEFGVTYHVQRAVPGEALTTTRPTRSRVSPDEGAVKYFHIEVPDDAEALRLDILKSSHPLDLYVSPDVPVRHPNLAEHYADSTAGRKMLVIGSEDDPALRGGTYFVAVRDPYGIEADFTLRTSFSPEPPEELLTIPEIETPATPFENAYVATVMLMVDGGTGSGSILTPNGLILTNFHVIEDPATGKIEPNTEIVVGVTTDPTQPVNELFLAQTRYADKEHDLVLLEIVSGIYGQPLPDNLALPFLEIAPEVPSFGEDLMMFGYPAIGSSTNGGYTSLTRGVVSGFDRGPEGFMIKTDADIAGGNSGGSAVNKDYQLVGVPTQSFFEEDSNGQMGFLVPVGSIPSLWREEIAAALSESAEAVADGGSDSEDD